MRYERFPTPLVASVAFREIVTFEVYQPLSPRWPASSAMVTGGVVSIAILTEWRASTLPAMSVAKYWSVCRPSVRENGIPYVCQDPLSTRYVMLATPLVASVAASEIVTLEMYQPSSPTVPVRVIVDWGGIVSIEILLEVAGSAFPARSVA